MDVRDEDDSVSQTMARPLPVFESEIKEETVEIWDSQECQFPIKEESLSEHDLLADYSDVSKEAVFKCEVKVEDEWEWQEHQVSHVQMLEDSFTASDSANGATQLKQHLSTHTQYNPIASKVCGKLTEPLTIEAWTSKLSALKPSKRRKNGSKNKRLTEPLYSCPVCMFKTKYLNSLNRHVQAVHIKEKPLSYSECDMSSVFSCAYCQFRTKHLTSLDRHVKAIHLEKKPFKCPQCDYRSVNKCQIEVHFEAEHLKKKRFICNDCTYTTARSTSLKIHIQAIHIGDKPYECTECEYRTVHKQHLKVHFKRRHTDEKPFSCAHCEFTAADRSTLRTHLKRKHIRYVL